MKKGDIIEGTITDYSFPNKGSFIFDDRKIIVKNTLPGTKAEIRIIKKKSGTAEGVLEKVIEESPLVTEKPVCPSFFQCGGCSYQHLSYQNQLELKEMMVKKLLSGVMDFEASEKNEGDFKWEGIIASPRQYQYRNKMEFSFGDAEKDGPLTLGLHRRCSTYDVISIDSCAIVDPAWNEILRYTQQFFRANQVDFYHKMQHTGILRNLVIRESFDDGSIMVNLVTTSRTTPASEPGKEDEDRAYVMKTLHLDEYVEGLKKLGEDGRFQTLQHFSKLSGVLHTENNSFADAIIPEKVTKLYGDDFLMESILGLKFKISPFSFFQTNTKGAEVLYSKAREYALYALTQSAAGEEVHTGVIYDLYSGTGTIAQLMSAVADKVYGIEIIEEAVEAAKENAKLNRLSNCEFIAGDVLKKLDEIEDKPDLIILDPPRDGINPKALQKIIAYGVQYMVYISCKPSSLARDMEILEAYGYMPVKGCCIDEFPGTNHVESCVLLQRVSNTRERTITLDVEKEDYYRLKNEGR